MLRTEIIVRDARNAVRTYVTTIYGIIVICLHTHALKLPNNIHSLFSYGQRYLLKSFLF